ncbi:hypothetical protein MTP99_009757 [Tenebrio molitor]|nr:hypothetical protein MTP99_009757 [Tenebrio molitor]
MKDDFLSAHFPENRAPETQPDTPCKCAKNGLPAGKNQKQVWGVARVQSGVKRQVGGQVRTRRLHAKPDASSTCTSGRFATVGGCLSTP